jgi:hypothetical protein
MEGEIIPLLHGHLECASSTHSISAANHSIDDLILYKLINFRLSQ